MQEIRHYWFPKYLSLWDWESSTAQIMYIAYSFRKFKFVKKSNETHHKIEMGQFESALVG